MKYKIFFGITLILFIISCEKSNSKIYVLSRYHERYDKTFDLNTDSMISLNYQITSRNELMFPFYQVNYIGPYNQKFDYTEYLSAQMYEYNSKIDPNDKFNFVDTKPFSLFEYISPIMLDCFIDSTQNIKLPVKHTGDSGWTTAKELNGYYVFIKNNSFFEVPFFVNRQLEIIMEAKDSLDTWRPIDYYFQDPGCGTGTSCVYLKPGYYILTTIPHYSGKYKTFVRTKIKTNNKIFYSNEVNMSINYSQFTIPYTQTGILNLTVRDLYSDSLLQKWMFLEI